MLKISRACEAGTLVEDGGGETQVKCLLPKSRLRPRTFRAAAGQTVLIGGLARVDVVDAPGATLYLTVWASSDIICHFGKSDRADERWSPASWRSRHCLLRFPRPLSVATSCPVARCKRC